MLKLIGLWLIGDGLISIYYFRKSATKTAQLVRWIRTGIGIYLLVI